MTTLHSVDVPPKIGDALAKASRVTGTNFDYLLQTALRESSFDKNAKADRSTATGLFQFVESTWLQTLKEEGARFGLKDLASQISKNSFGNYVISNPATKARILDLRKDPEISAMMAGAYAQKNENYIENKIGRKPSTGEIYIAHFLGARDAAKLILLTESQPAERADKHFALAAGKNRNIFFDKGKPRNVAEVYDLLVNGYKGNLKQGVVATGKSQESGWSVTIQRADSLKKPLLQPAKFKASDDARANPGSIGAWTSIVGVQEEQGGTPDPKTVSGNFSDIYSKK